MSAKLPCSRHFKLGGRRKVVSCLNAGRAEPRFCERYMCADCSNQTCSLCAHSICAQCLREPENAKEWLGCCNREHYTDEESYYGGKEPKYVCRTCHFRCRRCFSRYCNRRCVEVSEFDDDRSGTYWERLCVDCVVQIDSEMPDRIKRRKI